MSLVAYLALLVCAIIAVRRSPAQAMLAVWLPVLLLVPDGFRAITPGIPDPNCNQAAMVPLLGFVLMRYVSRWRMTFMDLLVLVYAGTVFYSDLIARGYSDAQNLLVNMLLSVVGPYLVARLVIGTENLHVEVAKRIVIIMFGLAVVGLFEAKMGFNPSHAIFGTFFPGQGTGWVTTFRHGLARVAGPFSHAILAGIMMVIAYRLQRWLQWGGHWQPRFTLVALPWDKGKVMSVTLFVGCILTVARGPWVGGVVAAMLVVVGRSKDRRKALAMAGVAILMATVVGGYGLAKYIDIKPGQMMTMSQESALYRKELFEKYFDIAVNHAWFGWGLTSWPKVKGMPSIDNYYLLLALMHGVPAMLMLVTMMMLGTGQMIRRGLREPIGSPPLAFTFGGIFLAVFISLGTVYMGEQVVPMFFFMLGWAQAWRVTPEWAVAAGAAKAGVPPPYRPGGFRAAIT
jgi:O-Antigen ligase